MLALAGSGTALATGLGALPVSRLGARAEELRPALWGLTVGLMTVASVVGLLMPALDEGTAAAVVSGLGTGIAFLLLSRAALRHRDVHVGDLSGASVRSSILVFGVLLVHSLPEGLAIGTAFASDTEGLGLFVILAIALQNVPEGTATAIPMEAAGFSPRQQFWAAVLTSAPQPVGALVAYVLVATGRGAPAVLVRVRGRSDAVVGGRRACPASLAGRPSRIGCRGHGRRGGNDVGSCRKPGRLSCGAQAGAPARTRSPAAELRGIPDGRAVAEA